ncbi:SDR family NAD(P)-dependent oxidoreductase [Gordonia sp. (in: high G+C Gram-positive bacteria)]|uniref:SDR family NAD(P)-dependent oxidoreductase n=1 Tax=Gordonia sp. (in: high G+C Gram-positive bacteria) TaxID=84139 RepID=UPI003C73A2D5
MTLPTPAPDSRVLITGASSGIGEALAASFARRGHHLTLVARREDRLRDLADRLNAAHGVIADVRPADLADAAGRRLLIDSLADVEVSVACLNAGFATYGAFAADPDRAREQVEVNVTAVHDLAVALVPRMVRRASGAVLITGSTAGNQPSPNNATYAATKAFANTLAESLHGELAGTGVTCTLLAPGPVRTEFADVSQLGAIESRLPEFAWVSADEAAEAAVRGLDAGRMRVVPGVVAKLQDLGGKYTPRTVLNPILKKVYGDLR